MSGDNDNRYMGTFSYEIGGRRGGGGTEGEYDDETTDHHETDNGNGCHRSNRDSVAEKKKCCGEWFPLILCALREGFAAYFFGIVCITAAAEWGPWISNCATGAGYCVSSLLFGGTLVNPIMTVATFLMRACTAKELLLNVASQFAIGYVLAAVTVKFGFGADIGAAVPTIPSDSTSVGFVSEFIGTFLCCSCVCALSFPEARKARAAVTGATVASVGIALSKLSGACFNPWFSLSTSLFSFFEPLAWIYYVAPVAGVVTAAVMVYALGLRVLCRRHCHLGDGCTGRDERCSNISAREGGGEDPADDTTYV